MMWKAPWHDFSFDDVVRCSKGQSVHLRMFANNLSQGIFKPDGVGVSSIVDEFCLDLFEALSLGSHLFFSLDKGFSFL